MKDILPEEMQLRTYLIGIIRKTYESFGFTSIETPCVEHIENLLSKQGGDNEKLIFKILKRGEKLQMDQAETETDLTDSGLRYDLTLPLSRYYSNNCAELPAPFKAIQIGNVWRADRPQKGRFRQFTQCDIDILGDATNLAETELILATASALEKVCPASSFSVRVNDRRILKAMAKHAGFPEEEAEKVFIILDKMDKIGSDGVQKELDDAGYPEGAAEKYIRLLSDVPNTASGVRSLKDILKDDLESGAAENLAQIMDIVKECSGDKFTLVFDPTLVRGMGYYTGTIFEIAMEGFSGSVAGGGRYDRMIGKFTGTDTPACGFSIGFERIISILQDSGFKIPDASKKTAFLLEKGMDGKALASVLKKAGEKRDAGMICLVSEMKKNKKFQKEQLSLQGYTEITDCYKEER